MNREGYNSTEYFARKRSDHNRQRKHSVYSFLAPRDEVSCSKAAKLAIDGTKPGTKTSITQITFAQTVVLGFESSICTTFDIPRRQLLLECRSAASKPLPLFSLLHMENLVYIIRSWLLDSYMENSFSNIH